MTVTSENISRYASSEKEEGKKLNPLSTMLLSEESDTIKVKMNGNNVISEIMIKPEFIATWDILPVLLAIILYS